MLLCTQLSAFKPKKINICDGLRPSRPGFQGFIKTFHQWKPATIVIAVAVVVDFNRLKTQIALRFYPRQSIESAVIPRQRAAGSLPCSDRRNVKSRRLAAGAQPIGTPVFLHSLQEICGTAC
jgi:hypothetical protein